MCDQGLLPAASSGPDTNAEHQAVVDALMARIAALKVEKNAVATAVRTALALTTPGCD